MIAMLKEYIILSSCLQRHQCVEPTPLVDTSLPQPWSCASTMGCWGAHFEMQEFGKVWKFLIFFFGDEMHLKQNKQHGEGHKL